MELLLTKHAALRLRQRGMSRRVMRRLIAEGEAVSCRGAEILFLPRGEGKDRRCAGRGSRRRCPYAVVAGAHVLTVGIRRKRFKR